MALILRAATDQIYLPDHALVGTEGALRLLPEIKAQIRRLDVSHNLLATEGLTTLLRGLTTLRSKFGSVEAGPWGLTEINLGCNGLDDESLDGLCGYAKKDVRLRKVWVQNNGIELVEHLDSIINSLNASHLTLLSVTNNRSLSASSVSQLFDRLTTPHLQELHLSVCNLGPEITPSVITYLSSPRSRNLEVLELNGNGLGVEAVRDIVDVIAKNNFTVKQVGLFANESHLPDESGSPVQRSAKERQAEERLLAYHVHERLPPMLERNRNLTKRVRRAAIRLIAIARVILNARPQSDEETARLAIQAISLDTSGPCRLSASRWPSYFPILDLPPEVRVHIVRHCSGDATALSNAQFARLRAEAEDRGSLERLRRVREEAGKAALREGREGWEAGVREGWLRRGRWEKWELDRKAGK